MRTPRPRVLNQLALGHMAGERRGWVQTLAGWLRNHFLCIEIQTLAVFPFSNYLSFAGSVGATERLLCLAPLTLDLKWGHGQHIRSSAPMKGDKNVIQGPSGCNSEVSVDQESVLALALTCPLAHPQLISHSSRRSKWILYRHKGRNGNYPFLCVHCVPQTNSLISQQFSSNYLYRWRNKASNEKENINLDWGLNGVDLWIPPLQLFS